MEKWDAVIAINLSGAFYVIRAALPGMKARGYGRMMGVTRERVLAALAREEAAA